jgi:hypothetical protein
MAKAEINLHEEMVMEQIFLVRGQKVMLDNCLATLYGVETKVLNQAVRRKHIKVSPRFHVRINIS